MNLVEVSEKNIYHEIIHHSWYKLSRVYSICIFQMSPFEGAPEEFDQTVFSIRSDRSIGPVENLSLNLVKDAHR